jgi:hypothetical protein
MDMALSAFLVLIAAILIFAVGGLFALAVGGLLGGCGARLLFRDVKEWRRDQSGQT